MLPLYVGALALGGLLIAAGVLMGGGHGDADGHMDVGGHGDLDGHADLDGHGDLDGHADVDGHGGGASETGGTPLLSMRFWTFFCFAFGLAGTLLTALQVASAVAGAVSVGLGVGVGWGAATVFRRLQRDQVSGQVELGGLRGAEAKVLLPVNGADEGKVRVVVGGADVDLPARSADAQRLERGDVALVVNVKGGVATVTSMRRARAAVKEP